MGRSDIRGLVLLGAVLLILSYWLWAQWAEAPQVAMEESLAQPAVELSGQLPSSPADGTYGSPHAPIRVEPNPAVTDSPWPPWRLQVMVQPIEARPANGGGTVFQGADRRPAAYARVAVLSEGAIGRALQDRPECAQRLAAMFREQTWFLLSDPASLGLSHRHVMMLTADENGFVTLPQNDGPCLVYSRVGRVAGFLEVARRGVDSKDLRILELHGASGELNLRVVDADGQPIPHATVHPQLGIGWMINALAGQTDGEGVFRREVPYQLSSEKAHLNVRADLQPPKSALQSLVVTPDMLDGRVVTVQLPGRRGPGVTLHALDPTGRPLHGRMPLQLARGRFPARVSGGSYWWPHAGPRALWSLMTPCEGIPEKVRVDDSNPGQGVWQLPGDRPWGLVRVLLPNGLPAADLPLEADCPWRRPEGWPNAAWYHLHTDGDGWLLLPLHELQEDEGGGGRHLDLVVSLVGHQQKLQPRFAARVELPGAPLPPGITRLGEAQMQELKQVAYGSLRLDRLKPRLWASPAVRSGRAHIRTDSQLTESGLYRFRVLGVDESEPLEMVIAHPAFGRRTVAVPTDRTQPMRLDFTGIATSESRRLVLRAAQGRLARDYAVDIQPYSRATERLHKLAPEDQHWIQLAPEHDRYGVTVLDDASGEVVANYVVDMDWRRGIQGAREHRLPQLGGYEIGIRVVPPDPAYRQRPYSIDVQLEGGRKSRTRVMDGMAQVRVPDLPVAATLSLPQASLTPVELTKDGQTIHLKPGPGAAVVLLSSPKDVAEQIHGIKAQLRAVAPGEGSPPANPFRGQPVDVHPGDPTRAQTLRRLSTGRYWLRLTIRRGGKKVTWDPFERPIEIGPINPGVAAGRRPATLKTGATGIPVEITAADLDRLFR